MLTKSPSTVTNRKVTTTTPMLTKTPVKKTTTVKKDSPAKKVDDKLTDKERFAQLKKQTEAAGMKVTEKAGKIIVTDKRTK
jgi:hypothetical protein